MTIGRTSTETIAHPVAAEEGLAGEGADLPEHHQALGGALGLTFGHARDLAGSDPRGANSSRSAKQRSASSPQDPTSRCRWSMAPVSSVV